MGRPTVWLFLSTVFAALGLAAGQSEHKLTAREIFFGASQPQAEAPKPAPARKERPPAPVAKKGDTAPAPPASSPAPPASSPATMGATYVQARLASQEIHPLAIRYALLAVADGRTEEVDSGRAFRSGDHIKLRVEVNGAGYLYIVHRGSSGVWKPLFPSPEIEGGDNRVARGRPYDLPPGHVFTFDEQPGQERLFLVFSREPEKSLEQLIYSLTGRDSAAPAPDQPQAPPRALLAQNFININDVTVDGIRKVYARDLIIEKADSSAGESTGEKAVYVASPAGGQASRVVADLVLEHR